MFLILNEEKKNRKICFFEFINFFVCVNVMFILYEINKYFILKDK